MRPAAIGYLRSDVSGPRQAWDEIQIRTLAGRLGYELTKTVVFSQYTVDLDQLIATARHDDAIAVVTPSLDHFEGGIPRQLLGIANVITVSPEETHAAPLLDLFHSGSTHTARGGEHNVTTPGPDGNAGNSNAAENTMSEEMYGRTQQQTGIRANVHNIAEGQ